MASSIDDNKETARLIRKLRVEKNLSQKQLADQAGVSFSFVNQVEGGKQTVRLDALNKILKVFNYSMAPQAKAVGGTRLTTGSQALVETDKRADEAIEIASTATTTTTAFPITHIATPLLVVAPSEERAPLALRQKNDWAFFQ